MSWEDDLSRAIVSNPDDDSLRLALADRLEEQGDPRGKAIRSRCLQIQRIKEKRARLANMDARLSYFGASSHRYQLNPPLPMAMLEAFESQHGVVLPEDYRDFVTRVGNGGAGPYYGLYSFQYTYEKMGWLQRGDIAKPFPLERSWIPDEDSDTPSDLPSGSNIRDGCIMLCHHGCAYWSFLIVTGKERGKIWDDFTTGDEGLHPTGMTFLAWYEHWLDRGLRREWWF